MNLFGVEASVYLILYSTNIKPDFYSLNKCTDSLVQQHFANLEIQKD